LGAAALAFSAFCAYFFRDPERRPPDAPDAVLAPADGVVLSIQKEGPGDLVTVRIFLSLWDVHVQRSPIAATVDRLHYQPGGFALAMRPQARNNERNSITLKDQEFRVIVEQIAGFIARRIACWVGIGQKLAAGQRLGMIYFGSQVAVHLPETCELAVRPGDKVYGGLTVIARRPKRKDL